MPETLANGYLFDSTHTAKMKVALAREGILHHTVLSVLWPDSDLIHSQCWQGISQSNSDHNFLRSASLTLSMELVNATDP